MSTPLHVSEIGVTGTLAPRSGNYKWWVLVTAIFGAFVSILDTTIVTTALPHIQQAFGTNLHVASYVTTAYALAQGVVIAASGFLANRFGIKRVYLLSLALFTLSSTLCGIAWNMNTLILFRVLQGASGAALLPLSLSLIFETFPEDQRGLANGIFGIPVLAAPALGPVIGGYLAEYVNWHWIFYVNVPIGIIGIVICWRMLRESELQPTLPFDLRGFLLIASGLGLLLFGVSNLAYDGWGSLLTVTGPMLLSLLLLLLFVPVELRTARPLLDVQLFTRRNFLVGNLITWIATVSLFGSTFLLPQYLQVLRGLSSFSAGLLLAPQGLAAIGGTIVVGTLYNRVGPRLLVLVGAIAVAFATFMISRWSTLTSPFVLLIPLLIVLGLALPFLEQTVGTAAMTGIEGTALPGANTLLSVSRSAVSSLAVAGLVNIVQAQRLAHQATLAQNRPVTVAITRQAQAFAYQDVFLICALVTLPLLVLAFFLDAHRRAQKLEQTTTGGVNAQLPETATRKDYLALYIPLRPWWTDVFRGLLGLSFVAVLVIFQVHVLIPLFRLIGVYLLADGVVDSYDLITGRRTSRRFWFDLLLSGASSGIGLLCVCVPQVTAVVLVNLVAVRISLRGISTLRTAWRAHDRTAGASWLLGVVLLLGGIAFALVALSTFAFVALFMGISTLVEGSFLVLRGLLLRFAPHHYLARMQPPVPQTLDLLPTLPPTTRRALVFVRRTGANGLGHIGWAFEWQNGWFTAGSVENRAGKLFALPEVMDFWATHTRDPIATVQQQVRPYDEYKLFYVQQPQPKVAWNIVVWESQTPYRVVGHNCCDVAYDALRSYGVSTLYDPAEQYVPNDWYDALDGPSLAIVQYPHVPIHLHRISQRDQTLHDQELTIPATAVGTPPPWHQQGHRAWRELDLVIDKMRLDMRLLFQQQSRYPVTVPALEDTAAPLPSVTEIR